MITDEEYLDALYLIREYNRQEYKKLPYEEGTISIGNISHFPARKFKESGEVITITKNQIKHETVYGQVKSYEWYKFKPNNNYE